MSLHRINKKGSFEIGSQMIFWLPRIFFLIIFIIVVTAPVGCFSKGQKEQIKKIEYLKADLAFIKLKSCLEKEGLNPVKVDKCFNDKNVGAKIVSDKIAFVINQEKYNDKDLCFLSEKCIPKLYPSSFILVNKELIKIDIELVAFQ